VTCVIATIELHYIFNVFSQQVSGFTLALVTPLSSYDHKCRHGNLDSFSGDIGPKGTSKVYPTDVR
jgi:hypothetical protein